MTQSTAVVSSNGTTAYKSDEEKLIEILAELGGKRVSNDTLEFKGTKFVIPETMTVRDAIDFLREWEEAEEEYTRFRRTFNFKPWDGAHALQSAMQKTFGNTGIGKTQFSFFGGRQPPESISIEVGVGKTAQVPWGVIAAPMLGEDATIRLGSTRHPEYGQVFSLMVEAPKKHKPVVEGLFVMLQQELENHSIYRGKAIDGSEQPQFIDLTGVDPRKVIYSDAVHDQLKANVWSLLEHTDLMRKLEVPLKRSILAEGPYGTGKTLALFLTGQIAVANGWTFIYCRPGKDDLDDVMGTARLYQPSVVCFEDVDSISSSGEPDHVTRLLDLFDGINAKGTEIMAVMTTNHPERIHKGMVRPGRLDAVIHIGELDRGGVQRMVEATIPNDMLRDVDYDAVYDAMQGYLPAFAKEATDRALRYAIAREGREPEFLTTEDFVLAAHGLRDQLALMEAAGEGVKGDPMQAMFRGLVEQVVHNTGVLDGDGDQMFTLAEKHD